MSDHPIEILLRPPVEMLSAITAASASILCGFAPAILMMTESVGYLSAVILLVFSAYRFQQGWHVVKYQRNLKRLRKFSMSSSQVPCYRDYLFLGKGFRWTQIHTQRLLDTFAPDAAKYVEPSKAYIMARKFELSAQDRWYEFIANWTSADSYLNPLRPYPDVGGKPVIHAVEPNEQEVLLPMGERVGHTLVLGTTRVGKTRLAEILIEQDIARNDGPVIVFDPKSDADLLSRIYNAGKRSGREDDVYVFHLGFPEISARYNAVGNFSRVTEVASRISGQLAAEGNSAAFKEFAWRFVNIVARAMVSMGERPNYETIAQHVTDIEPLFCEYLDWWLPKNAEEGWLEEIADLTAEATKQYSKNPRLAKHALPRTEALRKYVETNKINDSVIRGLLSALRYDRSHFDKLVASLLPLLEKLTTGNIGKLIAPDYLDVDDERPIFDWTQVIRKKAIVYIGLDALTDTEVAAAVGNSMFSDLVSTSGSIYKHGFEQGMLDGKKNSMPKICLHADEFNELMGDEFLPMVNKSGGSGMQITAYTQSRGDIEAKLGSAAKARQVEGNFNNLIMLRVKEAETAELLTNQLPEVEINQKMTVSGANDSSDTGNDIDFTSSTQDRISKLRVPMLEPSNLTSLPKGQAFCLLNGGILSKVRFPLPAMDKGEEQLPGALQDLTAKMRKSYYTAENWWAA